MRLLDRLIPASPEPARTWDPLGMLELFTVNGNTYALPLQTTMPGQKAETIPTNFQGYVAGGLYSNSVVFAVHRVRVALFSQGRFQWQNMGASRPGDLFGTQALSVLEKPWAGGTTSDLLAAMLADADFAGTSYTCSLGDELVRLRPDWVRIILADREYNGRVVGQKKAGYMYHEGGMAQNHEPIVFAPEEVCQFSPQQDPLAWYRGMSWMTPVIREIMADGAATTHKLKFFENAATPNLAVSMKEKMSPTEFEKFMDLMDQKHKGVGNAYSTLYTANGADVTVIGANMQQLDFKNTQGTGETRIAAAGGIHPTVVALSEGMQGSSLNAGNFGQARRQTADITLAHLWDNVAGSLETIVPPPPGARLWVDTRDIPFLREDQKDAAEIQAQKSSALRTLIDAGFEPASAVTAIDTDDMSVLKHTGLFSVQLQEAGAPKLPQAGTDTAAKPARTLSIVRDANGLAERIEEA